MSVSINPTVAGVAQYTTPGLISQAAVPVIIVPNGTVATNGTITLGTALGLTYSAGAWVYLPAGAIVAGSAGLYWCVFSSTTVGVVKTNFINPATPFSPLPPTGTLVTATGSNAAYTQSTTELTLANVNIPGGIMGLNGCLRVHTRYSVIGNTNTRSVRTKFGGTNMLAAGTVTATTINFTTIAHIYNRNSLSSQIGDGDGATGGGTLSLVGSINSAIDQSLTLTAILSVATDYIILDAYTIEVLSA